MRCCNKKEESKGDREKERERERRNKKPLSIHIHTQTLKLTWSFQKNKLHSYSFIIFLLSLSLSLSVFLCSLKCFKYFKEIICKNKVCFNFFLLLFRVYAYVHMYMCVCLHNIYCIQVVSVCSFQVIESKRKRKIQKKKIKKTKECQT